MTLLLWDVQSLTPRRLSALGCPDLTWRVRELFSPPVVPGAAKRRQVPVSLLQIQVVDEVPDLG